MRKTCAILGLFVASGCSSEAQESADLQGPIASTSQPIMNGTAATSNLYSVAVYHYTVDSGANFTGWWPRPCSGTIVRRRHSRPDWTYILTARHCVTIDGTKTGTLLGSGQIRVTTDLAPGTLSGTELQTGPVGLAGATVSAAGSPVDGADAAHDVALLSVPGYLNFGSHNFGVRWYEPTEDDTFRVWGYGRNTNQYDDDDEEADIAGLTGAGVLRYADVNIDNVDEDEGWYRHSWVNAPTLHVTNGDSGSGQFLPASSSTPHYLIGVTSTTQYSSMGGSYTIAKWLQSTLGHLHLASLGSQDTTSRVGVANTPAVGGLLRADVTTDDARTAIAYDDYWGELEVGGLCVTDVGSRVQPQLQACTQAFRQLWKAETNDTLRNMGTGRCLKKVGALVKTATCDSTAAQKWFWLTT